jgi:antitoxin component YwqK of YwqJK toxin-antitoxin module
MKIVKTMFRKTFNLSSICLIIFCLVGSSLVASMNTIDQQDNINKTDEQGRKQGKWIILGKDRPSKGYPDENKIEEGNYKDNRKEGVWTVYYPDGTIKLKGEFNKGRPKGQYTKYHANGNVM